MYVRVPRSGVSLDLWLGATSASPSMGATFSSVMSNMAQNAGLASLFGSGSKSSGGGMKGMNMIKRSVDYIRGTTA